MSERYIPKQENEHVYGRLFWGSYYPLTHFFLKEFTKKPPKHGDFVGIAKDPINPDDREKWGFLYWIVGPDGVGSVHCLSYKE